MENKKGRNFFWGIIAIILGWTLFKKFDFEKHEFENTALAIVYIIIFVFSVYFLIKDFINKPKE